jgi:hypothetical protein
MKKSIFYAFILLMGCKSMNLPNTGLTGTIDFKSWHTAVMDSFENKTGYGKGAKRDYGTSLGIVYHSLNSYSEPKLNELLARSKANNENWDRMFILHLLLEGETNYKITSILLYKNSKYRGVSFDGSSFYDLKYISKFKIWKMNSKNEFGNNGYIVISEFDKQYKNISNRMLIGVPLYEVDEKILKIYDSAIFD